MPSRYLTSVNSSSSSAVAEPPTSINVDSDFIVIIAALFCALICVVGLAAVARCAWLRRAAGGAAGTGMSQPQAASANKGLKKKILRELPKLTFNTDVNGKLADCPICLTEFVDGDEIRVLPQCGHTFHVGCIDTWLGSHSSCPSCRQILVVGMCHKCGGLPATSASTVDPEAGLKAREDDVNRFLP